MNSTTEKTRRRMVTAFRQARRRSAKQTLAWRRQWPAVLHRIQPGDTVTSRTSGRLMEVVEITPPGLLALIPAPGDPERDQCLRHRRQVAWPPEWVWFSGQQMELF